MSDKKLKAQLRIKASKHPEKYFPVEALKNEGFSRYRCRKCSGYFWSTVSRRVCGETECVGGYSFFGRNPAKKSLDFVGVWRDFSQFFNKRGYTPIKRYPVVTRWRDDMYFNIASIANFQPYVVTGLVDPPANPLVVPQVCLRFNDLDNVGITGRHNTSFTMIGQHAFESTEKFDQSQYFLDLLYWFTKSLGIKKSDLQLHEDAWAGGGSFGPSIEFFSRGLELANQVYHLYHQTPRGPKELRLKVLDMGLGQERPAWYTNGKVSSFDANMPTVTKYLYKKTGVKPKDKILSKFFPLSGMLNIDEIDDPEKVWSSIARKIGVSKKELKEHVLPLAALYSIADHTRTLLYAISDGALPSNTGGGHNLRILLRRSIDFTEKYGWDINLKDVIKLHAKYLKPIYPELSKNLKDVNKIIDVEIEKYKMTKQNIGNVLKSLGGKKIGEKKLIELYDSKGLSPDLLKREAKKYGIKVNVPANFYAKVAERHDKRKELTKEEKEVPNVAITQPLYYSDERAVEFTAKILKILDKRYVILNETLFYSTGGGQAHDIGTINGAKVVDVQKWGKHIIHEVEDINFKERDVAIGRIDWDRRWNLMRHHTGTHVVGGATRRVLGNHIWQAGSDVKPEKARLDVTHYKSLTKKDLRKIEKVANDAIKRKLPVIKELMLKGPAEKKFGFSLYQGGFIPGAELRVINIKGFDVQACGGTHLNNTSEIGLIKITGAKRIQDGVIRIEYVCGDAAKEYLKERVLIYRDSLAAFKARGTVREENLEDAAEVFSVQIKDLPRTIQRFVGDVRKQQQLLGYSKSKVDSYFSNLGKMASLNLVRACSKLFKTWKTQRRMVKKR